MFNKCENLWHNKQTHSYTQKHNAWYHHVYQPTHLLDQWPHTKVNSVYCSFIHTFLFLYTPNTCTFTFVRWPISTFTQSNAHTRTLCCHYFWLLLYYQNSPFLILINWRILWHFSLYRTIHHLMTISVNRRRKKYHWQFFPFFKRANYNIHQNWFSSFYGTVFHMFDFMAHPFIFPLSKKTIVQSAIFRPNGRTCLVFLYINICFFCFSTFISHNRLF